MAWRVIQGDTREEIWKLEPGSVDTVVTSPPYYGLRRYLPEDAVVLRRDLTEEEREYVLAELRKAGLL